TAERRLSERGVQGLSADEARDFGQSSFVCPSFTQPFLVRALYVNGASGHFSVHKLDKLGSNLLVSHESLGEPSGMLRTALVVCLAVKPSEIFPSVVGAR